MAIAWDELKAEIEAELGRNGIGPKEKVLISRIDLDHWAKNIKHIAIIVERDEGEIELTVY